MLNDPGTADAMGNAHKAVVTAHEAKPAHVLFRAMPRVPAKSINWLAWQNAMAPRGQRLQGIEPVAERVICVEA